MHHGTAIGETDWWILGTYIFSDLSVPQRVTHLVVVESVHVETAGFEEVYLRLGR